MTATELAPRFFLAAAVILLVCRGVQWLAGRVGQPPVVADMVAGVLLGPSLLGAVWPWAEQHLFATELRPVIYVAGQIGLVALMFQAGRELRGHLGRRLVGTAATTSLLGVLVPFGLGVALTLALVGHVPIFVPGVSTGVTAAFVGTALAITAFPMLARIIVERGLGKTRHGTLSLAAGALDDVVAWVLLAGVVSVAAGQSWPIVKAVGGGVVFVVVVVLIVRPLLARLFAVPDVAPNTIVMAVLLVLFLAAWWTDEIGLYAVFGAFTLGLALPTQHAARTTRALDPVMGPLTTLFVPMFFVYSGLNTRFGVFDDASVAVFAALAVVVAVVGKLVACWAGARLRGEPNSTAVRVGVLMNARGLMQLIALNVGLQAGIVTPELFTALVLVALVTTIMTSPLLSLLDRRSAGNAVLADERNMVRSAAKSEAAE